MKLSMVKMEIMQRTKVPRTDQLQGIDADGPNRAHRQGLAGLSKSRALFSFQRSETRQTPSARHPSEGWVGKADGELSLDCCWCQQGVCEVGLVPAARAIYVRSRPLSPPPPGLDRAYIARAAGTRPTSHTPC